MKMKTISSRNVWQVALLILLIFLFRILYVDMYLRLQDVYQYRLYDYIFAFLDDTAMIGIALILNLLFVYQLGKRLPHGAAPIRRTIGMVAYLILSSILLTVLVNRRRLFTPDDPVLTLSHLILSFLAILLVNAVIVVLADLGLYFRNSARALKTEKDKKRKAQYQYHLLKQQLNPHFLFNSLNILDYLVQARENDRASQFIRKMAGVYRYLLRESEHALVPLKKEMEFTLMYIDLLKERFADGVAVEIDVPKTCAKRLIVPCGLQLLVENATKHNTTDADHPLYIRIFCEGDTLVVRNNVQLKIDAEDSTGFGLSSIRKQYLDIAQAEVRVIQNKELFEVRLPLL